MSDFARPHLLLYHRQPRDAHTSVLRLQAEFNIIRLVGFSRTRLRATGYRVGILENPHDSSPLPDLLMYMLMGFSGSSDSKNRSWAVTSDDICSVTGPCKQMMRSCNRAPTRREKRDEPKHDHPYRCSSDMTHVFSVSPVFFLRPEVNAKALRRAQYNKNGPAQNDGGNMFLSLSDILSFTHRLLCGGARIPAAEHGNRPRIVTQALRAKVRKTRLTYSIYSWYSTAVCAVRQTAR